MEDGDYCSKPENSWSIWSSLPTVPIRPVDLLHDSVVMTTDLRKKFNSVVQYFRDVERRFCTRRVSKGEDARLEDLTFYPLNLTDPFGTNPMKRDNFTQGYVTNGTFEGDLNFFATLAAVMDIPYKAHIKRLSKNDIENSVEWIKNKASQISVVPDGIGRMFLSDLMRYEDLMIDEMN
ncbi:hypothetical protein CC86DRAFT_410663 [Ophiobolus disseminans]|uniref:Uncharacterized protein n=1 Tax=Ophiobolus disseminans TaxID=1469910 RepID=A0A6A6ZMF6_9PLEO|nr:hypothetical protein CC86DRAFT_410663 [Ophiobolus disseminans]